MTALIKPMPPRTAAAMDASWASHGANHYMRMVDAYAFAGNLERELTQRGEVVVTRNESGAIVAVTRQDKEGRILSVIAEAAPEVTFTRSHGSQSTFNRIVDVDTIVHRTIDGVETEIAIPCALNEDAQQRLQGYRLAEDEPQAEPLYRVVRKSNHDNEMIDEAWASEPLPYVDANDKACELNKGADDSSLYFHMIRPEIYKLYKFEP